MKKLKDIPVIGDIVLTNHELYGLIHPDEPVSLIIFLDEDNEESIIKPENIDSITDPDGYFEVKGKWENITPLNMVQPITELYRFIIIYSKYL